MSASTTYFQKTRSRAFYSCFSIWGLCAIFLLGSAAFSGSARAESPPTPQYTIQAVPFLQTYMVSLLEHQYEAPSEFPIPVIWLFSPDGKMVAQATDDASLAALASKLSSHAGMSALPAKPDLSLFNGVLAKSAGVTVDSLKPTDPKMATLVFIGLDSPGCHHCAGFAKSFFEMQKSEAGKLHAIHVLLTD